MNNVSPCPNCQGKNLYKTDNVSAGTSQGPNFLPGLGGFFTAEKFSVVLCKDCGLTRFFARSEATSKLPESNRWEHV